VAIIWLYREHDTYTAAGDLTSETYVLTPGIQSLMRTFAKLQLSALGRQTPAGAPARPSP
jgi:hypothetical protein